MKKGMAIFMAAVCAAVMLAGCGKSENYLKYVTLGEYKGLEVSVEKSEITDTDVQEYIESLMKMYPAYEETDKTTVETGDSVNIDYEGLLDGVAFDGGTAQSQVLTIGSGKFIPGFEDGLIGAKVGDELALDLTFPDPYKNNPDLAGKAVVFNVKINAIVQEKEIAYEDLTDEYVTENMSGLGFEGVEGMKEDVRTYLQSLSAYYAESDVREAVLDKLKENCTVNELPEGLLEERVQEYNDNYAAMVTEQYGMELEDFLEQNYSMTVEEFNEGTNERMQETLEEEYIILAIAQKEGMEADEEGYAQFVSQMMSGYGYDSEEALYEQYGEDYVKDSYICSQVLEMLVAEAQVTYTTPDTEEE